MSTLSIVIPVLDEAQIIVPALSALSALRARGAEVIVVDGGSRDGTPDLARPHADRVLAATRGRGSQMNAGARAASGDTVLFLHTDTRLPPDADRLVTEALASSAAWGRFDVRIAGRSALLPCVAALMNLRSRLTGIATGDQAIFVRRQIFLDAGGFPETPLMEDIELSRRLKRFAPPRCLRHKVTTSGRRWEHHGVVRTIVMMWTLRLKHFFGADAAVLARRYGHED
jgi:rSAM/selenodomain-associated transferase 2